MICSTTKGQDTPGRSCRDTDVGGHPAQIEEREAERAASGRLVCKFTPTMTPSQTGVHRRD